MIKRPVKSDFVLKLPIFAYAPAYMRISDSEDKEVCLIHGKPNPVNPDQGETVAELKKRVQYIIDAINFFDEECDE